MTERISTRTLLCMIAILVVAQLSAFAEPPAAKVKWQGLGMSGRGGMSDLAMSPADPNVMMIGCDMSGSYISRDSGQSWGMIHYSQIHSTLGAKPAFHPTDPNIIFASQRNTPLKVSRDGGRTWKQIVGGPKFSSGQIVIDPSNPQRIICGSRKKFSVSLDGGAAWTHRKAPGGNPIGFHFDQTDPNVIFAGTEQGVYRSDDGGATWAKKAAGLLDRRATAFAAGSNAKTGQVVLYCALATEVVEGKFTGGIYKSFDKGQTWTSAMGDGISKNTKAADQWAMGDTPRFDQLLTTNAYPRIVYAANTNTGVFPPNHATIYRSPDAGDNWAATFYPDPRFKKFNVEVSAEVEADGMYYQNSWEGADICASDPNRVTVTTAGSVYLTTNGGRNWDCIHMSKKPGSTQREWIGSGLYITGVWNYYIDPHDPKRHYIAYTDLGFVRSLDAGRSWIWWKPGHRVPWRNTCYELLFEPTQPGKMWGAFSATHDIPNSNIVTHNHKEDLPGGIALSKDFGENWDYQSVGKGLPAMPIVSIIMDPNSLPGKRTLYASVYHHGVYKSTDDGVTWVKKSAGLGGPNNNQACKLVLHKDGTLFVVLTGRMTKRRGEFIYPGPGLYRSRDGAESWQLLTGDLELHWPKDFSVDADDSNEIYLGASNARVKNASGAFVTLQQSGLYRTRDGGGTWTKLATKGPQTFGGYQHPNREGWIYMTLTESAPGAGLWLSKDDGKTWKAMTGLPFKNAMRVQFLEGDDVIHVGTFGGSVWRGPASED